MDNNNTCPCGNPIEPAQRIGSRRCQCHVCRLCGECIEASEAHARYNNEVGDTRIEYRPRPRPVR